MDRLDGASVAARTEIRAVIRSSACRRLTTFNAAHRLAPTAYESMSGTQFESIVDASIVLALGPSRSFEDATALRTQVRAVFRLEDVRNNPFGRGAVRTKIVGRITMFASVFGDRSSYDGGRLTDKQSLFG